MFLDLNPPKQLFLFNIFGVTGFKDFTLQDDQKIINKMLHGINDFNKRDNVPVINIISLRFSITTYEDLKQKEEISKTVIYLFHLLKEFGKLHNVKEEVAINLVDDQLQETESNTCGLFLLYFYENLFLPLSNSKIIKEKQLNKETPQHC